MESDALLICGGPGLVGWDSVVRIVAGNSSQRQLSWTGPNGSYVARKKQKGKDHALCTAEDDLQSHIWGTVVGWMPRSVS